MEHVEALGHDVVLVAVPLGCCPRAGPSPSGTAFPACPSLGALLVAMDRESAKHPRHALPIPHMLCPASLQACMTTPRQLHTQPCMPEADHPFTLSIMMAYNLGQRHRISLHEADMGAHNHHHCLSPWPLHAMEMGIGR